jgi:hypothetical protein
MAWVAWKVRYGLTAILDMIATAAHSEEAGRGLDRPLLTPLEHQGSIAKRREPLVRRVARYSQNDLSLTPFNFPMGIRRRFLGWVPYQGLGTPSPSPPFRNSNLFDHAPRAETAESPSSYGAVDRSINSGVSFGKGGVRKKRRRVAMPTRFIPMREAGLF